MSSDPPISTESTAAGMTTTTTFSPLLRLPYDVIQEIVQKLCHHCEGSDHSSQQAWQGKRALASLCLVSKSLKHAAQPTLYHSGCAGGALYLFAWTLAKNPSLAQHIRVLIISPEASPKMTRTADMPPPALVDMTRKILGPDCDEHRLRQFIRKESFSPVESPGDLGNEPNEPSVNQPLLGRRLFQCANVQFSQDAERLIRMSVLVVLYLASRVEAILVTNNKLDNYFQATFYFVAYGVWGRGHGPPVPVARDRRFSYVQALHLHNGRAMDNIRAAQTDCSMLSNVLDAVPSVTTITMSNMVHNSDEDVNINFMEWRPAAFHKITSLTLSNPRCGRLDLADLLQRFRVGILRELHIKLTEEYNLKQRRHPPMSGRCAIYALLKTCRANHLRVLELDNIRPRWVEENTEGPTYRMFSKIRPQGPDPRMWFDKYTDTSHPFFELEELTISSDSAWYPSFTLGHLNSDVFGKVPSLWHRLPGGTKLKHLRIREAHAVALSDLVEIATICKSYRESVSLETLDICGSSLVHSHKNEPTDMQQYMYAGVKPPSKPISMMEELDGHPHEWVERMFAECGVKYTAHDLDPEAYWCREGEDPRVMILGQMGRATLG